MTARHPMTPAIRMLQQHKVTFEPHLYSYEERGGTAASARQLGVDDHSVIKTLVFENDRAEPLLVLMHGDLQVSAKELARLLSVKRVQPCQPDVAQRHSGYQVGGTSPFGTRKVMPVYMEETIAELPKIYINGGGRGFLVALAPAELQRVLGPKLVQVSQS